MDVRVVLERIVTVIVLLGLTLRFALRLALEMALYADFAQSVGQRVALSERQRVKRAAQCVR